MDVKELVIVGEEEIGKTTLAATAAPFDVQTFRTFHEIYPFPGSHTFVIRYLKLSRSFTIT